MSKKKNLYIKLSIYFAIFAVFAALATYFFFQANSNREVYQSQKNAQLIEENMPVGFIIKNFGISEQVIFSELHLPDNRWNRRYTITQACRKKNLDCPEVVKNLNKIISK